MLSRNNLYRFPWSKTDNPGGWVEVTDYCNLHCTGCYRHRIEGHRNVEEIKKDVDDLKLLTNCDSICIAGGEPLQYPNLLEIVEYIASKKIKPMLSSNGVSLTPEFAANLSKAGLSKIHFHIDSTQDRPGWENKSEPELNELRQYYADILYETKKIQCGYHVTINRSTLKYIPDIVRWGQQNIKKVHHLSFLAFRSVVNNPNYLFVANGKKIDHEKTFNYNPDPSEVNITSEELFEYVLKENDNLRPSAYLNGTSAHETNKFLIIVNVSSTKKHFGVLGKKTMELSQAFYHLFNGRYFAFLENPNPGKILFMASIFDKEVRKAFSRYLKSSLKNPLRIFDKIYLQSIHLQQPIEIVDDRINLCDDCVNMMMYDGKLINSCRLDEYRIYGGPMDVIKQGQF
jgi:organic radical activating enzyme